MAYQNLEGHTTFGELVHIQRLHDSLDMDGDAISMDMIIRWNELIHRTLIQSHDTVMLIGLYMRLPELCAFCLKAQSHHMLPDLASCLASFAAL